MSSEARWPALMDRATAAAYLGVAEASLRRLLEREGVRAVQLGLRLRRWRRSDLDALLDQLPLRERPSGDASALSDPDRALAAVERSSARQGAHARRASRAS